MTGSILLAAAVALGAVLRIVGLSSESLWLDEGITAWRMRMSFPDLLFHMNEGTQGSLYYLALRAWCSVFGTSEAAMRLPSAICGILTIPIVERLGRRWFGPVAGGAAALLLAVNPFAIHYSQEARPYAAFLLLVAASTLLLARLLGGDARRRDAVLYVLTTAAALCVHAYGVFLLVAHAAAAEIIRRAAPGTAMDLPRRRFVKLAGAAALVSAPALFLFALEYTNVANKTSSASWIPDSGLPILWTTFAQFFGGAWVAGLALAMIPAVLVLRARADLQLRARIFAAFAIVAAFVLLPWAISLIGESIYFPRYTIPALAPVLLLAGAAIAIASASALVRAVLLALLLLASAAPLYRYYTLVDKDPWREAATMLTARSRPGDVIAVFPHWTIRPLEYYLRVPESVHVAAIRDTAGVEGIRSAPSRVLLVRAYNGKPAVEERIGSVLEEHFVLDEEFVVNDSVLVNPSARHIATIRVSQYSRREPSAVGHSKETVASRSTLQKEIP